MIAPAGIDGATVRRHPELTAQSYCSYRLTFEMNGFGAR